MRNEKGPFNLATGQRVVISRKETFKLARVAWTDTETLRKDFSVRKRSTIVTNLSKGLKVIERLK